jgi:hypothetical protein
MTVGQNFDYLLFFQPITGQQTSQICDVEKSIKS